MKGFLKSALAVALILSGAYGMYWYFTNENKQVAKNDDSYKVVTLRDKSKDGIYTLTKEDEHGRNTWDEGLIMYVKDDKIISCSQFESETYDDIRKKNNLDKDVPIEEVLEYCTLEPSLIQDVTGFSFGPTGGIEGFGNRAGVGKAGFVYYDKEVDFEKDYKNLKQMGVVPGYDEKSNEIWLSKLLKNKNSQYKDGYTLHNYKSFWSMHNKCPIEGGGAITNMNALFNAGLDENNS